jgi:porin
MRLAGGRWFPLQEQFNQAARYYDLHKRAQTVKNRQAARQQPSSKAMNRAFVTATHVAMLALPMAEAQEPSRAMHWTIDHKADVMSVVEGASPHETVYLDNFNAAADFDLERLIGWNGASLHINLLSNSGGSPNENAATMDGLNNIEVSRHRAKVFEFNIRQAFASERGAATVGFFDLNADFYANDAAGVFINPAFGIGAEIAATGEAGPSIFPSAALGVKTQYALSDASYIQAGLINAQSGVPGDPNGLDTEFRSGALLIAETGVTRNGKLAIGAWTYTDDQADIRTLDASGALKEGRQWGGYSIVERPIGEQLVGFAKAGFSVGDATPFSHSFQSGLVIAAPFAGRENGQLGFGLHHVALNKKARLNALDAGVNTARGETGFEIVYADRVTSWLTLQPSLQVIDDPGGDQDEPTAIVAGLRMAFSISNTP